MPYSTPTLQQLINQAQSDVTSSALAGVDGFLPVANLPLMAVVQAGLAFGHYDAIAYAARQATPFYSTGEWLEGWAALKDVYREDATAAGATGTSFAAFQGTVGADLPAGTPVNRGDGFAYVTQADATVANTGTVTVPIVATTAGSSGNCASGALVTLGTSVTNINPSGVASGPITGGTDQETNDSLRSRMLQAYQNPPQGGAPSDYVTWALAVPGVTRAWVNPLGMGAGTVVIYVMLDSAESAFGGFPQGTGGVASSETRAMAATGDQLIVANSILPKQQVTALVYVCAPTPLPIAFSVATLSPNTAAIQSAIAAALQAMLLRKGAPGGIIWPSDINEAIAAVDGIGHFTVTAPTTEIVVPMGDLPTVGTITYAS